MTELNPVATFHVLHRVYSMGDVIAALFPEEHPLMETIQIVDGHLCIDFLIQEQLVGMDAPADSIHASEEVVKLGEDAPVASVRYFVHPESDSCFTTGAEGYGEGDGLVEEVDQETYERFKAHIGSIAEDVQESAEESPAEDPEPAEPKGGMRARKAAMLCDMRAFQTFMEARDKDDCRSRVCRHCNVESRRILDNDEEAGRLWDELHGEYVLWLNPV